MFTLDTRISTALVARPELRELLPAFHPAFKKLQHPVLGRIMPRLVTVRDAARVAGVSPQALLDVMNLKMAPTDALAPVAPTNEPAPPWLAGAPLTVLDLQDSLSRGEEPLSIIMASLRTLSAGDVLQTLTPFEPAPLRTLLAKRGWESHTCWDGPTCQTSFFHRPDATLDVGSALAPTLRLHDVNGVPELDVRGLEPPQPLRSVLAALDAGHLPLRVRHHREPALLYPRLTARDLKWTVSQDRDDHIIVIEASGAEDATP